MGKPTIINTEALIGAGIDPKTGLPIKFISPCKSMLKQAIKAQLRVKEENEFVNRYVWYNLPANISSAELERLLYYKGQLCFFYFEELDEFYIMPYALDGSIDFYQRYNEIHPIPMSSGPDDKPNKAIASLLQSKKLKVKYGVDLDGPENIDDLFKSAVIIRDYTNQLPQTIIPRQQLNDPLLDTMAEMIPLMRTRLILGTGVKGVRVNDADQAMSVKDGSKALEVAAISGEGYVPIVGNIEFQELTDNAAGKSEEYMLAYQALDNFRKETIGLPSSGVYEKKAHMLASEQAMNGSNVDLVLQDGLQQRQNACDIINSIWGLNIWCDVAQNISLVDADGDGTVNEENVAGENSGTEGDNNDTNV